MNEWYSMSRLRLLRASSASSLSPSPIGYYSDPSPGLSILDYCSHSSQQGVRGFSTCIVAFRHMRSVRTCYSVSSQDAPPCMRSERSATIFPATWCDCASARADHDLRSLIVRSRTTRHACDSTCPTLAVPATLLLLATLRVVCPEYLTRPQS